MSRTPVFTAMLWTTALSGAAVGCGDPDPAIVDAAILDTQTVDTQVDIDAPDIDAAVSPLTYGASLAMTATCGGSTAAGALTITNSSASAVTLTGATATGGFSALAKLPLTIEAGASVVLDVAPPDAVIGTDVAGASVTGVLTLTSDAAAALPTVALTSVIQGALIGFTDAAGNPVTQLAMNSATAECPTPATIYIKNTGNQPAQLFSSFGSSFALGGFTPSSDVAPGETVTQDVRVNTFGGCSASEVITYSFSGPSCDSTNPQLVTTFNIAGSSSCFCS